MSLFRKAALNFFLLVPLLVCASPSSAEVSLQTRVGFHGLFQLGRPFPLTVDLTNSGRPIEGIVEIKVWKGSPARGLNPYPFYYRREVFLSAQARRSVQFTVDPDFVGRPLTVSFSSPRETISKEIDLRRNFSPAPLVLLLTENNLYRSIPAPSVASGPIISLSVADLPSDAKAFQGVSTVVIYEQSLRDLSAAQGAALEGWLFSGGKILALGSMHYALYQEPTMSRFLPVRVVGLKRFSSLPALDKSYGSKASPLRDLVAQDSRLVEGRVLLEEEGTPLLVETTRGKGKVFYLSLDVGRPPFSRWEGLPRLLGELLGSPAGEGRARLEAPWDASVFSQLLLSPYFVSAYVPIGPFFFWLFVYLGGMGSLTWMWQKQGLSRRALLIALLFLILISSCGGYLHFERGGKTPDGIILSSTLLESLPQGYAEAQTNVALFSTQRRSYSLQFDGGWSDFELLPGRPDGKGEAALFIEEEGKWTRYRFALGEWDFRLLRIRAVDHFPIRAEIEKQDHKLLLKVANLTSKDLRDCWLVASGQQFFLGEILKGSSQTREFSLSPEKPSVSRPNQAALREVPLNDRVREFLFRYSFFPSDQGPTHWGGDSAIFFGWVQEPPRRVRVHDARVAPHDYTLFRAVIPLGEEADG